MLQRTCSRCAIFTEAQPSLLQFSQRNFLPNHPLKDSNLWLDEDDFEINASRARKYGVSNPLRINVYSHHPKLSPYSDAKGRRLLKEKTASKKGPGSMPAPLEPPIYTPTGPHSSAAVTNARHLPPQEQYAVPICSTYLYRRHYYFNLEQMMMDYRLIEYDVPSTSGRLAGYSSAGLDGGDGAVGGEDVLESLAASRCAPMDVIATTTIAEHYAARQAEAIKALRARFLQPPTHLGQKGQHQMLSAYGGRPFLGTTGVQLTFIAQQAGYHSVYWATAAQWARMGAGPLSGQVAHPVVMRCHSKLVHVSLLENAEDVLKHSFISGKSGKLLYNFSPDRNPPAASMSDDVYEKCYNSPFLQCVTADMLANRYTVPLYFGSAFIRQHQLTLKPGVTGIPLGACRNTKDDAIPPTMEEFSGDARAGPRLQYPTLGKFRVNQPTTQYFYHLSQVHFPSSFRLPLCVLQAELSSAQGVALHGVSGRHLPYPELQSEHIAHADPQLAAVLQYQSAPTGELCEGGNDGSAQRSVNGLPPLILDTVSDVSTPSSLPAVVPSSAKVTRSPREGHFPADPEFTKCAAARADPTQCLGRSLWFLSEDVLRLAGVVDVNATPVGVCRATVSEASCGEEGEVPSRSLFNVACLMNEEDGFRLVNQKPQGGPIMW